MTGTKDSNNGCCTIIKNDVDDTNDISNDDNNESSIVFDSYQIMSSTSKASAVSATAAGMAVNDNTEVGPLNFSSNILLVYRLNEMRHLESVNFTLAILCLVYW